MKSTNTPSSSPSRLALRMGLSALALAGTFATVTSANAVVVTSTTSISVPNSFDGIYINFLTGATGSSGGAVPGWDFNPYSSSGTLLFYWGGDAGGTSGGVASTTTGPYIDLALGATVSAASVFSQSANGANSETSAFQTAGTHTLGFRFLNETTGATNYGYLTIVTSSGVFPVTITGWSYENTGAAITVVPEPATWGLFAMGALAVGARLRQQRRKAA